MHTYEFAYTAISESILSGDYQAFQLIEPISLAWLYTSTLHPLPPTGGLNCLAIAYSHQSSPRTKACDLNMARARD